MLRSQAQRGLLLVCIDKRETRFRMKTVCVFCGSKVGVNGEYREAAAALGRELLRRRLALVFGGGSVGLMGVLADTVLAGGGKVTGVIPRALSRKELRHPRVHDMYVVDSMHDRKAIMSELADAFIALPGGFGTLEELFEVISWAQLGIHRKPIGLFNIAGYFDPLVAFIDHAIGEGFIKPKYRELFLLSSDPAELLDLLASYQPPVLKRWMSTKQT